MTAINVYLVVLAIHYLLTSYSPRVIFPAFRIADPPLLGGKFSPPNLV